MPRMNWRWVKKKKEMCRQRDGDVCWVDKCMTGDQYRAKYGKDLELDHRDGRIDNNEDSNLGLATHKCNCKKNPRRKGKHPNLLKIKRVKKFTMREREWDKEPLRINSAEMKKNIEAEPVFRRYVERLVRKYGAVENKDLVDSCAEIAGISQQTGRKYLDKLCAKYTGKYEYWKNPKNDQWYVRLKRKDNA